MEGRLGNVGEQIIVKEGDRPVVVYYCRGMRLASGKNENVEKGIAVRVVNKNVTPMEIINCGGVKYSGADFEADMEQDNAIGIPKKSGATCVLYIRRGTIQITKQKVR